MGKKLGLSRAPRIFLALVCVCWLLAGVAALPLAAGAGDDVASLRVSQAVVNLPQVRVFLDMDTAAGTPAPNVRAGNLSAAIGAQPVTVKSLRPFTQSGEGVAYIFLVDISKSLKEKQFRQMRQVLDTWIDAMNPKDQAAIMTFGSEVAEAQTFTGDRDALKAKIAALAPTDQQTQLHLGLVKAIDLGHRLDPGVPSRKVIVVLSDGQDDYAGGLTRQVVLDKMRVDPVPVYAIGYSNLSGEKRDQYLKSLGEFAVTSGGAYIRADSTQFAPAFDKMRRDILGVYVLQLACDACQADGAVHRLQVNFLGGPTRITDGLDIRLLSSPAQAVAKPAAPTVQPVQPQPEPQGLGNFWWLILLVAVLIAGLAIWIFKKPPEPPPLRGLKLRLTQIKGDPLKEPFEIVLNERLVIGRDPACDVALTDDTKVSRRHCELIRRGEDVWVQDLGSKNATLVNGVPITGTHKLENDDTIALGNVEFRLGVKEL